jgi:N-acetyl-gamma-glutamyl-phosphate reductase
MNHPNIEISSLSSVSFEGKSISEVHPNLAQICDDILVDEDAVIVNSDVVFASLPHGLCEALAKKCDQKGNIFIDLGADFRLESAEEFKQWYGLDYKESELHLKSVYCIPELHRDLIKDQKIIANPGCYPTSIGLGLAPLVNNRMIDLNSIVIDSKSGVTGAGRGLSQTTHYPDCNEAFSPYKIAQHRHTPEIEQTLSDIAGEPVVVTFVPHLLPVNRGIVSTIYAKLNETTSLDVVHGLYKGFYRDDSFVRVLEQGAVANLKNVKYSNYCDISLHYDERTNRIIIISTIDNMVKGAAGQAIQNMNIVLGLNERTGLDIVPPAF